MHSRVELPSADGVVPAEVAWPAHTPRGALVVVQEAFGVDDHIIDVCTRFADVGYVAVAPHLFHRDGVNALPHDLDAVKPHMARLQADDIYADLDAARNYLAEQGFSAPSTGIVGFCMGGSIALVAATHDGFGAAVTFYGGGLAQGRFGFPPLLEIAPEIRCAWLGLFGDLDESLPTEQVEALRDAAATSAAPTSIVRYAQAGHAFHNDTRPDRYHEASAKDAWEKMLDWFGRYLVPRAS